MTGDLSRRCVLQGPALVEHEDAVGQRDGLDRIVRDDQADASEASEVSAQGMAYMRAGRLVECG